jgi:hypothetical protein
MLNYVVHILKRKGNTTTCYAETDEVRDIDYRSSLLNPSARTEWEANIIIQERSEGQWYI